MAKDKISKNSRAARRATSPGINTDQSLKDIKPPSRSSGPQRPSVLAAHHASGVQKKVKRKSQMTSKARRRQERGMQMAEAVMERTSKKVERSFGRGRRVTHRRKGWDEINKEAQGEADRESQDEEDEDEEGEGNTNDDLELDEQMDTAAAEPLATTEAASVPLPQESGATEGYIAVDDQDGEIL